MANLLGTTVNGALFASGRISVTYDTDKYQFNFLRASGSNWWVTNDSTTLGLHVNNVGDRFYFSTAGDFYSDTNGWLSTALAGKSNVGHTHDDRYYTETESDGRFQPLENQRLSTTNSPTFVDVYANEWFRNNNSNEGLYNTTTTQHWSSQANGYWDASSTTSVSAIRFYTGGHVTSLRGHIYANSSNEIGFLNSAGNWGLRMDNSYNVQVYGALTVGNGTSSDIYMTDTDEGNRRIHCNSGRIGFLSSTNSWGSWAANDGSWNSDQSMRAPIFYDSNDTSYYLDPNSTSRLLNVQTIGYVGFNGNQTRDKLRVWDSGAYAIGMKNGYDYGHLGTDEYAMSFQMNDNSGRGFWWGDESHNDNQGAASLTTDGRMVIAKSLSIGEGEAVVSPSSTPLYVKGTTSGADVVGVDGINGRLFTVTDDLSGSLFSVNTIAGLPVIEAFADNTVTIGKYGYATTWSTTGFMTVPNSANIYRDLFINGGRSGDFGNRLIIGTDAATYTMNDSNQRPTAYLHGQYPVLTLNHTVTSNGSHGPTIQFTHHTADKQWVIGSNGTGTRLDIGYSTNTNRNPHNGIDDLNGSTFIRVDNSGNVQLGRGNGRSTWVNDTLYVGASDSGDSHMYFGEDSSGWYGLHWYWDSGYIVYLYGRNAGTDTEIMRYTTNNNTYVEWRRNFHMNNYEINYLSQLHFNAGTRFVGNTSSYLNFQTDSTTVGGIIVRDGNSSVRGYADYFDSSGFGLLNSSGSWGIRLNPGNGDTLLYSGGNWKLTTTSAGVAVDGNVYTNQNYGHGLVGLYSSTRYQGVFAMGDSYKLAADGTGTGTLYGIAWTHTNVGGQSKSGLGHQALFMDSGVTQTAIGSGIWTNGLITTTSYGTSADWNTAFGWGNHASAGYQAASTAITTSNIGSQSVSNATTVGGITPIQFFNNMGDSHGTRTSFDASTPSYNFGFRFIQGNTNGPALGGGGQFYSWYLGLGNDYPATGAGSYGMHVAIPRTAVTPYMSVRYNENNSLGSWIKIAAGYADTAGALSSMNISQFTNNSGYITGISFANVSSKPTTISGYGITDAITTSNIGSQSVSYATSAGSAPNASNVNLYYNVSAGVGYGLRFWGGSDEYKISMGVGGLYQYGPVTDYSIKTQMDPGSTGRGFTWGNNGVTPVAALNATSGNMQIAGTFTASNFSGSSSGTNTGDQTNISGNAGTVTNGVYTTGDQTIGGLKTFSSNITNSATADWYMYGFGLRGASAGQYGIGLTDNIANRTLSFHVPNIAAYSNSGNTPKFGWYSNGSLQLMSLQSATGNLVVTGTISSSNFSGSSSGTNTGDQTNISGNAATATNVAWSGVTSKPAGWLNTDALVENMEPSASAFPSGFYQSYLGAGNPTGTWFNYINVRHSNTGNGHGFQLGMSYYDTNLWFRSYQGSLSPTFSAWAYAISSLNIASQSVNYATSAGSATSSTTATTANRLERYGVIYGNNWNDYYLNNRFIVASAHNATGTNKPDTAYNYGSTLSYYNSGEDHYQIYVPENSVNSNGKDRKMYYRSGWNGSWGGWRSVVDVYNSVCYIDAAVTATGDITAFSDGRVKENVETLEGALDKTLKLRGVSYNRTDIEDKSTKIGVIAQEILEVVPEVVSQDENGMYAVSYGNITALLIEAIKEQQKQIEELKEIINGLTK